MSDEKTQWGSAGNLTARGLEEKKKRMPLGSNGFLLQGLYYPMAQLLEQLPEIGAIIMYVLARREHHILQKKLKV